MAIQDKSLKMAVIVGASCALSYKETHPRATEKEVLDHVHFEMNKILNNLKEYD